MGGVGAKREESFLIWLSLEARGVCYFFLDGNSCDGMEGSWLDYTAGGEK